MSNTRSSSASTASRFVELRASPSDGLALGRLEAAFPSWDAGDGFHRRTQRLVVRTSSTGSPAARQPWKPDAKCATLVKPMSPSALAAGPSGRRRRKTTPCDGTVGTTSDNTGCSDRPRTPTCRGARAWRRGWCRDPRAPAPRGCPPRARPGLATRSSPRRSTGSPPRPCPPRPSPLRS